MVLALHLLGEAGRVVQVEDRLALVAEEDTLVGRGQEAAATSWWTPPLVPRPAVRTT